MSLAISELNVPGTTELDFTPASTRTPGPDGGSKHRTGPGVGRKPRPTSSALMRNSIEWGAADKAANLGR
jgi:hypothetical protein